MDRMGVLSCSAHGWNKGIGTRPPSLDRGAAILHLIDWSEFWGAL
jgi:hypothetical protein